MGQVNRIYVKPGQKVNQGDLLLQIRNQDILAKKAQVEASKLEAKTAFESAQKDLKRFEALYEAGSASDKGKWTIFGHISKWQKPDWKLSTRWKKKWKSQSATRRFVLLTRCNYRKVYSGR